MVRERPVQEERGRSCRIAGGGWKGRGRACAGFEDLLSLMDLIPGQWEDMEARP